MALAGDALTGEALPEALRERAVRPGEAPLLSKTWGETALQSGEDAALLLQTSGIWGARGVSSEPPTTCSLSCSDPRLCGEESAASRTCWANNPSTEESPSEYPSPSSQGATVEHQEGSGWPRSCSRPPLLEEEGAPDDSRVVRRECAPRSCCRLARYAGLSASSGLAEPLSREYLDTAEGWPPLQLLKRAAEAEAEG